MLTDDQMEPTRVDTYRGWETRVYPRGDGTFTAVSENEHVRDELPDELRPIDERACLRKARRAIALKDSFDPQFRSAAFKDFEPQPVEKWLMGHEPDLS